MLLNDFFYIREKEITDSTVLATIDIDPKHIIFEGHFPGQPVVPGVCMMQMFTEIMETVVGMKLTVRKSDHLKFLAVINPLESPTIQVSFTYEKKEGNEIVVSGKFYKEELNFLKFKATLAG